MITILAEKPSVGRDIAQFLGATTKKDGYFEGNGYAVTWAFGHLISLADAKKDYGYEKWSLDTLPILPDPMKLVSKDDVGARKQLYIIKELFAQSESIICATDSGREGELIFRYIYEYLKCTKPFKRLWVSSLTQEALKQGFANLKDGRLYDNLYYSAKARSEADWLVGINSTIAMTVKANAGLLSLGRVQTPTLAMIAKRCIEHQNFVPVPYFVPQITLQKDFVFKANFEKNFSTLEEAQGIVNKVSGAIQCTKVLKKEQSEMPPKLYDLTSLQQEANKRLGFTAQETLDLAQSLYEKHKILSYPRTSSCYLSDDFLPKIPSLMQMVKIVHPAQTILNEILQNEVSKRPIDNTKITDHHAIIPTEQKPNLEALTDKEKDLYIMVVSRFIQAFYKPCIKHLTELQFASVEGVFKSKGTVISVPGWRGVSQDEDEEKEEDNQGLPEILENETLEVKHKEVLQKKTTAPPLLTEASLLTLMETAGKLVEDEESKQALKACGIGTPATRASTIETLFKRGFAERQGKKIMVTGTGLQLFQAVEHLSLSKADLTGDWEKKLNLMAEGQYEPKTFDSEIKGYVTEVLTQIKGSNLAFEGKERENMGKCPVCKKGVILEGKKGFGCSAYKEGCTFVIWKEVSGKKISESLVKTLLEKGKTTKLKGFTSKAGKSFEASLVLKENKVGFEF